MRECVSACVGDDAATYAVEYDPRRELVLRLECAGLARRGLRDSDRLGRVLGCDRWAGGWPGG